MGLIDTLRNGNGARNNYFNMKGGTDFNRVNTTYDTIHKRVEDLLDSEEKKNNGKKLWYGEKVATILDDIDRRNIVIGIALRQPLPNIEMYVNKCRVERGLEPVDGIKIAIRDYKNEHFKAIDDVYALIATRISETFSFSDKITRIAALNDLAEALQNDVMNNISSPDCSKIDLQKASIFIKIMQVMNDEMGSGTLVEQLPGIERRSKYLSQDENKKIRMTKKEEKARNEQLLLEKYADRIPGKTAIVPENETEQMDNYEEVKPDNGTTEVRT